jgi:large subunit ribosomal protein L22
MEYQATAKYVRASTRKVRLVADSVRTLKPSAALKYLSVMPKMAAVPLSKTIASAIANAKQKGVSEEQLSFKTIEIMGAAFLKRFHAASRGMAHGYKKRMTHIRVIVQDNAATLADAKTVKVKKTESQKVEKVTSEKKKPVVRKQRKDSTK